MHNIQYLTACIPAIQLHFLRNLCGKQKKLKIATLNVGTIMIIVTVLNRNNSIIH